MSEQNILNPAQTSLLNYAWGYSEGLPEMRTSFQASSGKTFSRRQFDRGRVYELAWNNLDKATMHSLRQWERQYENDFFTLADWERSRYFSGRFDGPLIFNPSGNEKWNIKGRFVELPGLALYAFPANWTRDAIFLEERNGFGEDLSKYAAGSTWTYTASGSAHGGAHAVNAGTVATDTAEVVYLGYGFRFWSLKSPSRGIVGLSATRVRDGSVALAEQLIDLYDPGTIASAALYTVTDLPLDLYRVKLRATNTKNASASGFQVQYDAIEAMQ